jgi:uncharacterized lipoprotein
MRHLTLLPLALLVLLAACSSENKSAGGVTPSEARALDDAAQMLDSQHLPAGAVAGGQPGAPAQPAKSGQATTKPAPKPAG